MTASVIVIWAWWTGKPLPWFIWAVIVFDFLVAFPRATERYAGWLGFQ